MSIRTRSAFTYGHTVSEDNQFINFSEDGITELSATIEIGSFYLQEFINKIAIALNEIGDNTYEVTLNRSTRKITISADDNFSLFVTTGTQASISAFSLIGFTTDRSGSNSYEADIASGFVYYPQAPLQDYVSFDDTEESVQSKVNESSSGELEVVSYGIRNFMECNIKYATDILGQGFIENNATGVQDLRLFMQYITKKRPIEFIQDKANFNDYVACVLESTARKSDGTGFQLRELYAEKLANYYESGKLVFRKIN